MTVRRRFVALVSVGCFALVTGPVVGATGATANTVAPACRPSQIRVTTGVAEGAAGTIYVPLVFTNRGAACALWGVPSVQAVASTHHPVGPPARNDSIGQLAVRHVVAHGQSVASAYGVAETGNYPPSLCHARRAWGVRVRLGPFAGPTYVRLGVSVCTSQASTHVQLVVPGRTGVPTS